MVAADVVVVAVVWLWLIGMNKQTTKYCCYPYYCCHPYYCYWSLAILACGCFFARSGNSSTVESGS